MFKKIIKGIVGYLSKLTVEQEDVVGVDITPNCIRVAQLSSVKKKWTLTKLGYKYIDGSSNHSIIENPDNYVNKLLQLVTASKIKTKSAAVSIPVSSAIIKVVALPLMTDEELKVAVASESLWENSVQLAENLDEYSIFWQVLKRDSAENLMHLLFVASKLDDIDNYLNIVRSAGLNPVVVDVRCFATRNALALREDLTKSDSPIAMIEFGAYENYILIKYEPKILHIIIIISLMSLNYAVYQKYFEPLFLIMIGILFKNFLIGNILLNFKSTLVFYVTIFFYFLIAHVNLFKNLSYNLVGN